METYIDKIVNEVKIQTHIKDDNLIKLYALLILTKGPNITLKDVHDAWSINMNFKPITNNCYGHNHHSIVPFEILNTNIQQKDQKYCDILNKISFNYLHNLI